MDYASPVHETSTHKRYIALRHRLRKEQIPMLAFIVKSKEAYCLLFRPGTPRTCSICNILEWGLMVGMTAFESIGYKNAFQVKILTRGCRSIG